MHSAVRIADSAIRNPQSAIRNPLPLLVFAALAGCAATPSTRTTLNEGYGALRQNQLDQAQAAADKVLAADASGRGAADALYLRGRVFEERAREAEGNPKEVIALLNEARSSYVRALALRPETKLDAGIRTQLANVAYFQEDFATAAREWEAAYPNLASPSDQAWALYRCGLSRQRLGKFQEADAVFAAVQQHYPGTDPAKRAAQRAGARSFNVQVGIFSDAANARKLIEALRAQGYNPQRSNDPAGKQIIAVGPVPTYEQAKVLQSRLAGQYPGTIILP
jgi:tetratricopeptide (TPR) repeat protein